MSNAISTVKDFISKHKSFIITSHVNPEGDSLGSQLAFAKLLKYLKKDYVILDDTQPPKLFNFFKMVKEIKYYPHIVKEKFDASAVLDCPTIERIGRAYKEVGKAPILNIDHHISNDNFGIVKWVEPNASSCGEMVYKLFKSYDAPIDEETATYLYVAILTDTGSFKYDNTTDETHDIVGELIKHGIKPYFIAQKLFEAKPLKELLFLGEAISNIKLFCNGKVSLMYITKDMLKKYDIGPNGTEEFINFARSVEGIDVAIFIKEDIKEDISSVSFRSKGTVDVNKLAKIFGGGGHVNASGCTVRAKYEKAKELVLEATEKFLKCDK